MSGDSAANLPYAAKYLKDHHTYCSNCNESPTVDSVVLGVREFCNVLGHVAVKWYHPNCFWAVIKMKCLGVDEASIRGMSELKWNDQESVCSQIEAFNNQYSRNLVYLSSCKAEHAKTDRAKCGTCKESIKEAEAKYTNGAYYDHLGCFIRAECLFVGSLEMINGYAGLTQVAKDALKEAMDIHKSGKMTRREPEEEEEEDPPTLRRSGRLIEKAAAATATDTSGMAAREAAIEKKKEEDEAARRRWEEELEARNQAVARYLAGEAERKKEEEAAAGRRRREEEEERAREAAEVERRRAREELQREFDGRVASFFERLQAAGAQPKPTTSQSCTNQLAAMDALLNDVLLAMRTAGDADTGTLQIALDEVRVKKQRLQAEVFILVDAEREAKGARQRAAEEARREESRKMKMEEGKKKTEEEERERMEKHRMEESMLDKECRICFDEIKEGMGCMMCGNVIGCKTCMDEWLKQESTCPFCRRNFTNVTKQIKKADEVLLVKAKKTKRAFVKSQNGSE